MSTVKVEKNNVRAVAFGNPSWTYEPVNYGAMIQEMFDRLFMAELVALIRRQFEQLTASGIPVLYGVPPEWASPMGPPSESEYTTPDYLLRVMQGVILPQQTLAHQTAFSKTLSSFGGQLVDWYFYTVYPAGTFPSCSPVHHIKEKIQFIIREVLADYQLPPHDKTALILETWVLSQNTWRFKDQLTRYLQLYCALTKLDVGDLFEQQNSAADV